MVFENLSLVYQNIRGIMKNLEEETGAKLILTLSSDEDFDEGILLLNGMDKLIDKYGVDNFEVTMTQGGLYRKAEFRLFGVKFSGYLDDAVKREAV